jgi:hypothetical protein
MLNKNSENSGNPNQLSGQFLKQDGVGDRIILPSSAYSWAFFLILITLHDSGRLYIIVTLVFIVKLKRYGRLF